MHERTQTTNSVSDGVVGVLSEGIALGEVGIGVFDQVEGLERPKGTQQLLHLQGGGGCCVAHDNLVEMNIR